MSDHSGNSEPLVPSVAGTLTSAMAYIQTLPTLDRHVATMAANGASIPAIAADVSQSEGAVARIIDSVLAAATGRHRDPVESGGLGADTDPGITGGYGDTGFGALDTEPMPVNEEPSEAGRQP